MNVLVFALAVACIALVVQCAALVDQVGQVRTERDHEREQRLATADRFALLEWQLRTERAVTESLVTNYREEAHRRADA